MGKRVTISVIIVLLMVFTVVVTNSIAEKPTGRGELSLNEKDLWGNVVSGGANGKLEYNMEGPNFDFELKAEGLEPNKVYVLIRSLEPQTNVPDFLEDISQGTSNDDGEIKIEASYNFDIDLISAEFLLVPVEMLELLTNGRPSPSGRYLSGQGIIGYNDTDAELKCGCQVITSNFGQAGIPIGEKAVDFTLTTTEGEVFQLYQYLNQEKKPLVMVFGAYT